MLAWMYGCCSKTFQYSDRFPVELPMLCEYSQRMMGRVSVGSSARALVCTAVVYWDREKRDRG